MTESEPYAVRLVRGGVWLGWHQVPPGEPIPRGFVAMAELDGWEHGWVPIETTGYGHALDVAVVALMTAGQPLPEEGEYRLHGHVYFGPGTPPPTLVPHNPGGTA